jgi:hypothetical protein
MVSPVAPDDVWAITGGSFTTAGTYGISPVQVLHWNGSAWRTALHLGGTNSVDAAGLVALSADDAYVIGQDTPTKRPFIEHWDGGRWRSVPRGPPAHIQPPTSVGLTFTSEGSLAGLETEGLTDRSN